ncbi:putative nuclease HARBI1 [Planococcus citri]|uniref:putative nuclease HARBI1 n=1 Tax=Planococcus citri TaxID=170843 RepID=UPI0031F9A126
MDLLEGALYDDDEELQWYTPRDPYTIGERINGFDQYTEQKFYVRYRMRKRTAMYVLSKIKDKIKSPTNRNHAIEPEIKLLLTLRFYAGGVMISDAGDLVGVGKSAACNIIRDVSHELAMLAPEFIQMPSSNETVNAARENFYRRARFPRVIGAIDCTHVRIQSPGGNYPEVFRNRKGYFSLNVQTISSADLKVLDIVARYPGSVHDQTVFNNSDVKMKLEQGQFGRDSIVVADAGYANTKYIATPLRNPNTDVQRLYNESIIRTRNPVERQYGVLKRRFPVLALGMRMKLKKIQSVIVACAVLHNICIDFDGDEEPPHDPEVLGVAFDDNDNDIEPENEDDARTARDQLLADYFPGLL